MHPDQVTVVVPTYNEYHNLSELVEAVTGQGYRLLVVDDNSPDGTGKLAEELSRSNPLMEVLHRPAKEGLGPAYAAGFAVALKQQARVVCEMDADFSHDPSDLPRLVREVEKGAGLALGSRYVPGGSTPDWPPHRRFLSRGGNLYARLLLALDVNDATGGFRAYSAECLRRLNAASAQASGYGFQVEMVMRAVDHGCTIMEIPIVFRDRRVGESKMNGRIVREAMMLVTRWGIRRRLRLRSRER